MAINRNINIGPVALTTTLTTNILNTNIISLAGPTGITITQPYVILKHIRILNKTAGAVSFSLWKGASGADVAGTEIIGSGVFVPANSWIEWYGALRMDASDFLVGGASAAASLTFQAEGEIGFN